MRCAPRPCESPRPDTDCHSTATAENRRANRGPVLYQEGCFTTGGPVCAKGPGNRTGSRACGLPQDSGLGTRQLPQEGTKHLRYSTS
jgi:hypothetical protein